MFDLTILLYINIDMFFFSEAETIYFSSETCDTDINLIDGDSIYLSYNGEYGLPEDCQINLKNNNYEDEFCVVVRNFDIDYSDETTSLEYHKYLHTSLYDAVGIFVLVKLKCFNYLVRHLSLASIYIFAGEDLRFYIGVQEAF